MFMPGPFELLILLLVVGLPLFVIVRLTMGARSGERPAKSKGISLGHVTLNCPHCQQETQAGKPLCEHCGEDL